MFPDAVIFDMDGVLVDTADAHYASWQSLAAQFGMTISREEFLTTFGRPSREIIRMRLGPSLSDDEVRRLDFQKEARFRELAPEHVTLIPHAVELVDSLGEVGIPLAVGSSAPTENVDLILDQFNLRDRFAAVVTGDHVSNGKPDPEVFRLAAERMGVECGRCVVIEDAPAGIQAARAAGMIAVAFTSSHGPDAFPDAHHVVSVLSALSPETLLGGES